MLFVITFLGVREAEGVRVGGKSQEAVMSLLRQKEVQERGGIPQVPFYQWMGTNIERVHVLNLKEQEVSKGEDSDGGEVRTQEREVT